MADQPGVPDAGDKFWEWLGQTEEALKKFVDIVNEFLKLQGEDVVLPPAAPSDGPPKRREIGQPVQLTTEPLTDEQLKALSDGFADAIVKDKALEFVKGFIAGLMVAA